MSEDERPTADIRSLSAIRADREGDNRLISPLETLEEMAREIRAGEIDPADMVIIFRKKTDPEYFDFRYRLSQVRVSDAVVLLTAAKARLVKILIGDG